MTYYNHVVCVNAGYTFMTTEAFSKIGCTLVLFLTQVRTIASNPTLTVDSVCDECNDAQFMCAVIQLAISQRQCQTWCYRCCAQDSAEMIVVCMWLQ